jgi:large repetitive protein
VLEAATVARASNLVVKNVGLTQSFAAAAPNGTYFTRIRAVNTAGESSPSNELSFGAGLTTPGAPRNLRVSVSGSSAVISWDAAAGGGASSGYILEAGSASGLSNIATVPVASTSFSVPVVPNGTYFVRVRATSGAGTGPASVETSFSIGGGPVLPPGAPTNLTSTVSGAAVTLAWSPPTAGGAPSSYTVQAGSAPGLSNLATVAVGATPSFSTSPVPSGTYFVRVISTNAAGSSAASNEVTIVVP